jgi:hypothetical protein
MDETAEQQLQMQQGGMDGGMEAGDQDAGRYGDGSEGYQPVTFSDYGQGGEDTEQRMGESEETEHKTIKAIPLETADIEVLSEKDGIIKARVYVSDQASVPKGRTVYHGARGKIYYITKIHTPAARKPGPGGKQATGKKPASQSPPDMPGDAKKTVKISGNGVALTVAEYSYGVEGKAAKNDATKKFVSHAKEELGDTPQNKIVDKLKTIAKESGLLVESK